jgi:hypothetical protein
MEILKRFLVWLRNVTSARHFFIFTTFTIALLLLYIYTFIFGTEKFQRIEIIYDIIMCLFVVHLFWILVSVIFHFIQKEWRPAIVKSILCIVYAITIYYIYGFSTIVFYIQS